jgi:predicted  nucleic acid-binding Zn-ribbon protein
MSVNAATATPPGRPVSPAENAAAIRSRMQRIKEDIRAAESKIERIRNRIERDRQALLLWQARMAGISHEHPPGQ